MFEISQLKEMKLPELQELAKGLNISKYRSLKKLDLVYQILDHQAANPITIKPETVKKPKPRRERVQRTKNDSNQKQMDFKQKQKQPVPTVAKDEPKPKVIEKPKVVEPTPDTPVKEEPKVEEEIKVKKAGPKVVGAITIDEKKLKAKKPAKVEKPKVEVKGFAFFLSTHRYRPE